MHMFSSIKFGTITNEESGKEENWNGIKGFRVYKIREKINCFMNENFSEQRNNIKTD